MKKNRFVKLASGLFVLCLMTTCVIGSTLAKYTTASSAADTARVAKWGVTVSTSGTLFGKDYASVTTTDVGNEICAATSTNITVAAGQNSGNSRDNVVAPGTKNDTGLQIKVTGTPEVAYTITAGTTADKTNSDIYLKAGTYGVMVEATGLNAATDITKYYTVSEGTYSAATTYDALTTYYELKDSATVKDNGYYPIKWSVKVGESTPQPMTTVEAVIAAIQTGLGYTTAEDETTPTAPTGKANMEINKTITVTWEWGFDDSGKGTNDAADTILGNLMAGATVVKLQSDNTTYTAATIDTDYCLTIGLNITVTATQVD